MSSPTTTRGPSASRPPLSSQTKVTLLNLLHPSPSAFFLFPRRTMAAPPAASSSRLSPLACLRRRLLLFFCHGTLFPPPPRSGRGAPARSEGGYTQGAPRGGREHRRCTRGQWWH